MCSKQACSGGGFMQVFSVGRERYFSVVLHSMEVSVDYVAVNDNMKFYCHNFGRTITQG